MLSKANGSKKFQSSITEMIAASAAAVTTARTMMREALVTAIEQNKTRTAAAAASSSASSAPASLSAAALLQNESVNLSTTTGDPREFQAVREAREKRKRELTDIDVILIDSSSESESDEDARLHKAARATFKTLESVTANQKAVTASAVSASGSTHGSEAGRTTAEAVRATASWAANAQAQRVLYVATRMQQKENELAFRVQVQPHQNGYSQSSGRSQSAVPTPSSSPTARVSSFSRYTRTPSQAHHYQPHQQVDSPQSMAIEPYNRSNHNAYDPVSAELHNLGVRQVVSSSAYETENSSSVNDSNSGTNGMMHPVVVEPITTSYLPPAASSVPVQATTSVPLPSRSSVDGWDYLDTSNGSGGTATNSMGAGEVHTQMSGTQFGNGDVNGFVVDNGGGDMHSMGMPSATTMAPMGTTNNNLLTTTSDWMANPLEDILYDRYYQINMYTVKLEQNIMMLNARIVQVSTQNLQAAQRLAGTLKQQQSHLQKAQANRLNALIALIVQSNGIMNKVKRLRMDTLCDIPQVQTASHKKCVELSQQITMYATNVATLHQQMAVTLDSANAMNANAFHQNVSSINQSIQLNEQSIASWKEKRDNEIVRIVQYTNAVREELKRAFHQQRPSSASSSSVSSSSSGPQQQQQQHQQWQRHQPHQQQHNNGYHR